MPEVLWACLVRHVLPRADALAVFRRVAVLFRDLVGSNFTPDQVLPSHSNLATHHPRFIDRIVKLVAAHPLGYGALRPLLLLDALPGREIWATSIAAEVQGGDIDTLADAVADVLWHQSEPSTDVRWLICLCPMLAQKIVLPAGRADMIENFRLYPDHGDMRKVRPSIRAMEPSFWIFNQQQQFTWSAFFWEACHKLTPCMLAQLEAPDRLVQAGRDVAPLVVNAVNMLSQHWIDEAKTTAVDPVHESAFAFVLYALRCLLEIVTRNRRGVAGRLLLRTIVECHITLAFLAQRNDPKLWAKYRRYGTGQAKLAMLKISELTRPPHSVSAEALEQIANEDVWEEFVDINLGNWAGTDLRKMAEESGTKAAYDAHYGWPSAHAHGQWSALRDTCLTTCLNPLHRLHRVPNSGYRPLDDVLPDALEVAEAMIADLLRLFPGVTVPLSPSNPPSAAEPVPNSPEL